MTRERTLALVGVVVGLAFVVLAFVYFIEPASSLPSFVPGHEAGSSRHHAKHGVASLVVGLGALAFAWFKTGPRRPAANGPDGSASE